MHVCCCYSINCIVLYCGFVPVGILPSHFDAEKTRMGLPDMVKKFKDMYNRLRPVYSDTTQLNSTSSWVELHRYKRAFRQNTGVWRTDGQTDILPRHIVRAMHTRRAVNSNKTMTCHALVKSNEHLNGNVFSRCLETSKCRWDDVRRQTGPYASPVESGLSIESGVYQGVSSRDHAGGRPTDKSMCLRGAMCAGTLLSSRAMCSKTEMRQAARISPNGVRSIRACTSTKSWTSEFLVSDVDISCGRPLTLSCLLL